MYNLLIFLTLLILLSGCAASTSVQNQAPTMTAAATRIQAPIKTTAAISPTPGARASATTPAKKNSPVPSATSDLSKATQPAVIPVLTQTSGGLTVQLFSDLDVEVSEPTYLVSGRAPAGAVLSINDEIIFVDQSQTFSVEVSLEDGPNLVEIIASDAEGNEVSFMITVSYDSQS